MCCFLIKLSISYFCYPCLFDFSNYLWYADRNTWKVGDIIVYQKELRLDFIAYLEQHYDYARPANMASNVFYAWHNDIGMPFSEIFDTESSMLAAKELLIKKFIRVGRKSPNGHATVHYVCWEKFRKFLLARGYSSNTLTTLS